MVFDPLLGVLILLEGADRAVLTVPCTSAPCFSSRARCGILGMGSAQAFDEPVHRCWVGARHRLGLLSGASAMEHRRARRPPWKMVGLDRAVLLVPRRCAAGTGSGRDTDDGDRRALLSPTAPAAAGLIEPSSMVSGEMRSRRQQQRAVEIDRVGVCG